MRMFRAIRYALLALNLHYRKRPETITAPVVVVLDNRFDDFFSQIDYLFSSGFLPADTAILSRLRSNNFDRISSGAAAFGIKVHFYTAFKKLPSIADGATLVYPFHAPINSRLMLERQHTHVFIGHGDSNKKASCNPMLRAYDYILVAGNLSRQRLIDSGILRPALTRDHAICIGTSTIDDRHAQLYTASNSSEINSIAYFPTWEGGNDSENYSSLKEPATASFLIELCKTLKTKRIILDPHPNLGRRRPDYRTALRSLTLQLLEANLEVRLRWKHNKKAALQPLNDLISGGRLHLEESEAALKYAVVDVSAAEAIVASRKIPSVVLWRDECDIHPASSYRELRALTLVRLSVPEDTTNFLQSVGSSADSTDQARFAEALFSLDIPEMADMPHSQRWSLLTKQYFSHQTIEDQRC